MTRILEQAIEQVKRLSDDRQNELGEMLLAVVEQEHSGVRLSPEQLAELDRRLAGPIEIVPDDEMNAFSQLDR